MRVHIVQRSWNDWNWVGRQFVTMLKISVVYPIAERRKVTRLGVHTDYFFFVCLCPPLAPHIESIATEFSLVDRSFTQE
jgi:hypothetical protein